MTTFVAILFLLICVLLIAVILLQKGRGGGLAGAFGGAGGHSAFGTRTGDMFTWITVVMVALFLLIGVASVKLFRPAPRAGAETPAVTEPVQDQEAPATAPAADAPATQPAE